MFWWWLIFLVNWTVRSINMYYTWRQFCSYFPHTLSGKQFSRKLNTLVLCSVTHCCYNKSDVSVVLRRFVCSAYDCVFKISCLELYKLQEYLRINDKYEVNVCHCTAKIWNGCCSCKCECEPFSCKVFFFFVMLHNLLTGEINHLNEPNMSFFCVCVCFHNTKQIIGNVPVPAIKWYYL